MRSQRFMLREVCWLDSQMGGGNITYSADQAGQNYSIKQTTDALRSFEAVLLHTFLYPHREIYWRLCFDYLNIIMKGKSMEEETDGEEMSPAKIFKSQRSLSEKKERKERPDEDLLVLGERLQKMEVKIEGEKRDEVKMVLTFIVLVFLAYFATNYQSLDEMKDYGRQLQQLQAKSLAWQKEVAHLQQVINSMRDQLDSLRQYSDKLANEIIDIHANELSKPQKSMPFFEKYSMPIHLQLDHRQQSFQKNYKFVGKERQHLKKMTEEEIIAYAAAPVSRDSIQYFKVRIEETEFGLISIGVFTQDKLRSDLDCGYCQRSEMYYLFCSNGHIYHGETAMILQNSKKSRVSNVKKGDIVTVFIDRQEKQIVWYVNGRYAETEFINKEADLYPFVLMTSRGDEVVFLT